MCERGASAGMQFDLFNFQDLFSHKSIWNSGGRRKKLKSIIGLLLITAYSQQ